MNLLPCIKCGTRYEEDDVEAYYCPTCLEEKKLIAIEVAKRISSLPKEHVLSDLQQFDEIRKQKGVNFVNIRDLGISL